MIFALATYSCSLPSGWATERPDVPMFIVHQEEHTMAIRAVNAPCLAFSKDATQHYIFAFWNPKCIIETEIPRGLRCRSGWNAVDLLGQPESNRCPLSTRFAHCGTSPLMSAPHQRKIRGNRSPVEISDSWSQEKTQTIFHS